MKRVALPFAVLWPLLLLCAASTVAQPAASPDRVEQVLRSLRSRDGVVDGAGLTRTGRRLWAIEPAADDPGRPTVVIVGGLDGEPDGSETVLRVLRWWFGDRAAAPLAARWHLSALPCARPEACDPPAGAPRAVPALAPLVFPPTGGFFDGRQDPTPHHVWRWTTMQAPSVVIEVRAGAGVAWQANALASSWVSGAGLAEPGSLAAALASGGTGAAWSAPAPALRLVAGPDEAVAAIQRVLALAQTAPAASPLRSTLLARRSRAPLDIARLLAPRYPAQPIMSYIPALAWSGALELARITGEARFRGKPLADMAPFLSGATPAIAEPYLLTSLAGHLALADLAAMDGAAEADALSRRAADFMLPQAPGDVVRFARQWTDDMFMATSVLARVAARTRDDRYAAAAGRLLTSYAGQLQRPDGLFMHARDGPYAWGRGNGFALFGLMDALTHLPAAWPDRARVLESYRALVKGLLAYQAPDGMWRQVVDEPGSYREFTVTAMAVTAIARGIRLGWIDAVTYRPVVERAWRGLLARVAEDGTLMDVCTGTGSGPTKQYYLDRAGLTGADDRGGAMGLTAAIEMDRLTRR